MAGIVEHIEVTGVSLCGVKGWCDGTYRTSIDCAFRPLCLWVSQEDPLKGLHANMSKLSHVCDFEAKFLAENI